MAGDTLVVSSGVPSENWEHGGSHTGLVQACPTGAGSMAGTTLVASLGVPSRRWEHGGSHTGLTSHIHAVQGARDANVE